VRYRTALHPENEHKTALKRCKYRFKDKKVLMVDLKDIFLADNKLMITPQFVVVEKKLGNLDSNQPMN
jgi:hypothetical protein